ncbi:hypothetical protein PG994_007278 [Apiospora phragmitis]|uniref:DUF6604 domain-containing protein n=1 Tax=Apiospora phragmitis TaxID=2905665 RepID=A0ABR1V2Y8_9PEZI
MDLEISSSMDEYRRDTDIVLWWLETTATSNGWKKPADRDLSTRDLVNQSNIIVNASVRLPRYVKVAFLSAIRLRQRCQHWFEVGARSNAQQIEAHRYFIEVLTKCYSCFNDKALHEEGPEDKMESPPESSQIFAALEIEDPASDDDRSQPQKSSLTLRDSHRGEYWNPDPIWEAAFGVYNIFQDMHSLRSEIKELWAKSETDKFVFLYIGEVLTKMVQIKHLSEVWSWPPPVPEAKLYKITDTDLIQSDSFRELADIDRFLTQVCMDIHLVEILEKDPHADKEAMRLCLNPLQMVLRSVWNTGNVTAESVFAAAILLDFREFVNLPKPVLPPTTRFTFIDVKTRVYRARSFYPFEGKFSQQAVDREEFESGQVPGPCSTTETLELVPMDGRSDFLYRADPVLLGTHMAIEAVSAQHTQKALGDLLLRLHKSKLDFVTADFQDNKPARTVYPYKEAALAAVKSVVYWNPDILAFNEEDWVIPPPDADEDDQDALDNEFQVATSQFLPPGLLRTGLDEAAFQRMCERLERTAAKNNFALPASLARKRALPATKGPNGSRVSKKRRSIPHRLEKTTERWDPCQNCINSMLASTPKAESPAITPTEISRIAVTSAPRVTILVLAEPNIPTQSVLCTNHGPDEETHANPVPEDEDEDEIGGSENIPSVHTAHLAANFAEQEKPGDEDAFPYA